MLMSVTQWATLGCDELYSGPAVAGCGNSRLDQGSGPVGAGCRIRTRNGRRLVADATSSHECLRFHENIRIRRKVRGSLISFTSGDRNRRDLGLFFQGSHQESCHTGLRRLTRSLTPLPYDTARWRACSRTSATGMYSSAVA